MFFSLQPTFIKVCGIYKLFLLLLNPNEAEVQQYIET